MKDGPQVSIDAAIARIRAFAAFKGWAKSRYAIEAGLAPNTLRDFDLETWSPTVDTLRALEALVPPDFERQPDAEKPEAACRMTASAAAAACSR